MVRIEFVWYNALSERTVVLHTRERRTQTASIAQQMTGTLSKGDGYERDQRFLPDRGVGRPKRSVV
jgi:hypothetical protein